MTLALAAWAEHDAARALHPADRAVIHTTEAARSLVLELFATASHGRDLFNACARLGGLMAEAGASPSLAAGAVDAAVRALADAGGATHDASRVGAARASLVEGYVGAVRDAENVAGLLSWEYPACAVPLEDGVVAIACGYPSDDGEALAGWAARVAGRLVKEKVKEAVLSGAEAAKAEVASALDLVGIEVRSVPPSGPRDAGAQRSGPARSWLRLPWRK